MEPRLASGLPPADGTFWTARALGAAVGGAGVKGGAGWR